MANQFICKNCGGNICVKVEEGLKCSFCDIINMKEISSELQTRLSSVSVEMQKCDFQYAEKEFSRIYEENNDCYEALFLKIMAYNGVLFVDDPSLELKKKPTINVIQGKNILESKEYKKLKEITPASTFYGYNQAIQYLEKVRSMSYEISKNDKPYDIFISFKNTVPGTKDETTDTRECEKMYLKLKDKGYNVFFSPVSLNKYSGQEYEPVIFNAINTASVMLVYGENPEYYNSPWVRNEWARFLKRVNVRDKQVGSLIPIYKNIDPGELPTDLKGIQALNASENTFYETLNERVKDIIDKASRTAKIDKVDIKKGTVIKKDFIKKNDEVKIKEIGKHNVGVVEASVQQKIENAKFYISKSKWDTASKFIDEILAENPNNVNALFYKIGINNQCSSIEEDLGKLIYNKDTFNEILHVISIADVELATLIIGICLSSNLNNLDKTNVEKTTEIFSKLIEYNVEGRSVFINEYLNAYTNERVDSKQFDKIYSYFDSEKLEDHREILANFGASNHISSNFDVAIDYYDKALELDNSCLDIIISKFLAFNKICKAVDFNHKDLKNIDDLSVYYEYLSFLTKEKVQESVTTLCDLGIKNLKKDFDIVAVTNIEELIKILDNPQELIENLAEILLENSVFEKAEFYFAHLISLNKDDYALYWKLLLAKLKCKNENALIHCGVDFEEMQEFSNAINCLNRPLDFLDKATNLNEKRVAEEKKKAEQQARDEEKVAYDEEKVRKEKLISDKKAKDVVLAKRVGISTAILCVIVLIVSIISYSASPKQNFDYSVVGNSITIDKYVGDDTEVVIPDKINGKKVTAIGDDAFSYCRTIKSIALPDSVTSIGNYAFYYCTSLTSVTIGDSVTSIGNYAFSYCRSLKSTIIQESVTSIGNYAFYNCDDLTIYCEVSSKPSGWDSDWNSSNSPVVWDYQNTSSSVSPSDFVYELNSDDQIIIIEYIGYSRNVEIPSTIDGKIVVSIAYEAFGGDTTVENIKIPNSVTSIGDYAFYYCTSLESITMPNSLKSIGEEVFRNCSSLESIIIPDSVTSIGDYTFYGCSDLENITIGNSVKSIGKCAFYSCSDLESVFIPSSVTSIGYRAFEGCSELTIYCEASSIPSGWDSTWNYSNRDVVWDSQSTSTRDFEFVLNSYDQIIITKYNGLSTVVEIPSKIDGKDVVEIGDNAFDGCSRLESIEIPDSVTSIGLYAFYKCSSLESIVIPDSITSIGSYAFYNCNNLTIYCEVSSKPSSWSSKWNSSNRDVVWGYED